MTNLPSPFQYSLPVLPFGPQYGVKSICRLVVASLPRGPRIVPRLITDGFLG